MATINDLAISISEMEPDILFNHIREIRRLRRLPPIKKTKAKKQVKVSKISTDDLISRLSSNDTDALIKLLEEK